MAEADWITVAEAAAKLNFGPRHVRWLLEQGKLEGKKLGRDWLVSASAVAAFRTITARRGRKPRPRSSE